MKWAAIGLMCIWPAVGLAEGFRIDFEAVFAAHADQVERSDDGRRKLKTESGVEIRETGSGIVGLDWSEGGAVGCLMRIYTEVAAVARVCDLGLEPAAEARLQERTQRLAAFFAENTLPRMDPGDRDAALEQTLTALAAARQGQCPDPGSEPQMFMVEMTSEDLDPVLDKALAVPRLPVANPCL